MDTEISDLNVSERTKKQLKRIRACVACEGTGVGTKEEDVTTGQPDTLGAFLDSAGANEKEENEIYNHFSCPNCEAKLDSDSEIIIESEQD